MSTNLDRVNSLAEFMEKEYGVTPENIDKKLEELKKEFFKKINNQNTKEAMQ